MLTATPAYRAALPLPHARATLIRVFHGDEDVTPPGGLPFSAGVVSAALNARVTRTVNLTVPREFYPETALDLLAPERASLQILTGIGYGDGSAEMFPVFTGRVASVTRDRRGRVTLRGDDRAADVVALRFETPTASIAGSSTVAEIRRFIAQVIPGVDFAPEAVDDQPVPQLAWDDDRGRALDELAASVQGRWYFLGDGRATVRAYPYAGALPVIRLADGEPDGNGGGLILGADRSRSRDGAANSVTVISERIDGDPAVEVTARDVDPSSPTFYEGLYGKVTAVLRPQTPIGAAAAGALARQTLALTTALGDQWTIEAVPDATLEPGDVITVEYDGANSVQVIDSISLPLAVQGTMTLQCRSSSDVQGAMVGAN